VGNELTKFVQFLDHKTGTKWDVRHSEHVAKRIQTLNGKTLMFAEHASIKLALVS